MLLTLASLATQAQDVYEYAVMSAHPTLKLMISYTNGVFEELPFDYDNPKASLESDQTVVSERIADMSKQGWEIVSFTKPDGEFLWRYLLKRKVK